jgi:hypothetical protein
MYHSVRNSAARWEGGGSVSGRRHDAPVGPAKPHRALGKATGASTAQEALRVGAGLTRWAIPYAAIPFVGESSLGPMLGKRVAVRMGRDSEILRAPDDPGASFADVARHAPHVMRRGAAGCGAGGRVRRVTPRLLRLGSETPLRKDSDS